jgi:hypothetical protein
LVNATPCSSRKSAELRHRPRRRHEQYHDPSGSAELIFLNDLENVRYAVINERGEKKWDWWVVGTLRKLARGKPKQHPIGITGHGAEISTPTSRAFVSAEVPRNGSQFCFCVSQTSVAIRLCECHNDWGKLSKDILLIATNLIFCLGDRQASRRGFLFMRNCGINTRECQGQFGVPWVKSHKPKGRTMTSSFTMPGGIEVGLFRAEPMLISGNQTSKDSAIANRGKVPTRWVLLNDPTRPLSFAPAPPTREADYVGQIIAVVASPATARI